MNISEANALNALVRALDPDANDDTMHRALDAVEQLGDRAAKTLGAGMNGIQMRTRVDALFTWILWGEEPDAATVGPPVETHQPIGGVL